MIAGTIAWFPPLEACIAPSNATKANLLGGGLQISSSLNLQRPLPKVHYVYNYINLPSTIEVAYIICGVS